jgi:hypothetical protein
VLVERAPAVVRSYEPERWIFGAALALFAVAAGRVLTWDLDRLLQAVPDDSFYYLEIARRLAHTGQSTFDGVSPTNGYHPLWMGILTVLAWAVDDPLRLLRAAIALSLGLHVCVAAAVFRIISRLADRAWAWTAAACWLISPLAFSIAIQATEAMAYALAAVLAFAIHLRLLSGRRLGRVPSRALLVLYGVALGVLSLARTDGLVIAALGVCWLAYDALAGRRGLRAAAIAVSLASASVAAVLAPWWLFSLQQVGTIVQDSGAMKILWASDLYPTPAARLANVGKTFQYFSRHCLTLMATWHFSWASFSAIGVVLSAAPVMVLTRQADSIQARALRAVLAPVLALATIYGIAFVDRQHWWLTLPCLAILVVMFTAFPAFLRWLRLSPAAESTARAALLALAVALFVRWHVKDHRLYPWQPDVRRSQLAIEAVVPGGERIGAFNAGIPAYFGSADVVALDGLVSHGARRYWTERRLDDYLAQHGIRFVADEERAFAKAMRFVREPLHVQEIASYPLQGWPSGRRVLWRLTMRDQ